MRWLSSKEPDRRQAAVVLGAGVVGIAAAYELQKEGYTVTVIDRQPEAASECSFSNGGHRNFHFNPSIAVPGTPREFLRSWVSPESTIFLPYSTRWCTLLWDPDFWQWALRLVPNFSARKVQRNSEAGTQLIRYSQQRTAIIQEQHLTVGKVWEWEGSTAVCTEPVPPDKIYKENEVLLSKEETLQREPGLAFRRHQAHLWIHRLESLLYTRLSKVHFLAGECLQSSWAGHHVQHKGHRVVLCRHRSRAPSPA
jgi:D-amino-acid dehydrogenase